MLFRCYLLILLVIFMQWGCSHPGKSKPAGHRQLIPLSALLSFGEGNYKISPDGKYLSWLKNFKNRKNLFIRETRGKFARRVTDIMDRDIVGYFWKGNDHLIYLKDFGGDENYHLYKVVLKTGETKDLTPYSGVKVMPLDDLPHDSDHILVMMNQRDRGAFDVHRINIYTRETSLVAQNPGLITDWYTDHNGVVRLGRGIEGIDQVFFYRKRAEAPFKKVLTVKFGDTLNPCVFTPDNRRVYALSNIKRDKLALIEFDFNKKRTTKTLFTHDKVDIESIYYSRKRKSLLGLSYYISKRHYHFFDEEVEKQFTEIQAMLPNQQLVAQSTNQAENLQIISASSDRNKGAYYLYDKEMKTLRRLARRAPWLDESLLAKMRPVQYPSRDGLTIHGYLTLPNGTPAKGLPLIVNPHGGPWERDHWGFNPEVQLLANRGYAVFQPNYRGSIGYGKAFWKASFGEWGGKMQDDITDGVKWLVKQGIVDAERVCIYGASFGGYATLLGLTSTPDLYACGIDYVGISNLFTFYESIPPYWEQERQQMFLKVGHPVRDKELFKRISPVFHVDKIRAPLMVIQGARDPRVNKNESDQIVEALRKREIEVKYIVKQNEGHGFYNAENRMELYQEIEKFLAIHLPPNPPTLQLAE